MDDAVGVLHQGSTFTERYSVVRRIKSGGMGAVYEVTDLKTGRRLALKTTRPEATPSPALRARFEQEARITAAIDSEHLVKIEDAGVDPESGCAFLTMELLEGLDLDALLAEDGPLDARQATVFLWQVALALEKVHDAGVIHRDLKPGNLFLTRRQTGEACVKVLDFGVAKAVHGDPKTTAFVGTPLYMPPEQIRGEHPDARTDTFALGHVAFTLLTAHAYLEPGNRKESATRRALRYGVTLPSGFDAWFERATHHEASFRFESAVELVSALHEVFGFDLPSPRTRAALRAPAFASRERSGASTEAAAASSFSLDGAASNSEVMRSRAPSGNTGLKRTLAFGLVMAAAGFLAAERWSGTLRSRATSSGEASHPTSAVVPALPTPSEGTRAIPVENATPAPSAGPPRPPARSRVSHPEDVLRHH